jgi:hypothetical protein
VTTTRNMYGCLPCPACGSVYRAPFREKGGPVIACDECGRRGAWDGTWSDDGYEVNECAPPPSQGAGDGASTRDPEGGR